MEKMTSSQRIPIFITQKLQSQITVLHNQCPSGKEWSGLLLFKIIKGSIEDLANLEISCEEVFLMDTGDATFTSFEANEDWIKFFDKFPQVDPVRQTEEEKKLWRVGKIHSHQAMSAFHSGVDTQDLYDNAPALPFFLSLVVNYACTPFAEIAVAGEIEYKTVSRNKWTLKNILSFGDNKIEKKSDKKPLTYIIPCDIFYLIEQWVLDQVESVKERNKPKPIAGNSQWDYRTPKLPYESNYTPTKNHSKIHNPKGYRVALEALSELFVLGEGTVVTFDQPPANTLAFIDNLTLPKTLQDYLTAFKAYFIDVWFDDHFGDTSLNHEEAIECIRFFLSADANKDKWIVSNTNGFKQALDELEKEIKLLRTVQGHAVV